MDEQVKKELLDAAQKALQMAYTPYSHFKVGAALLGKNGVVYTGCNIENAAFSPTICAERSALAKAVSEGCQEFSGILIVSEDGGGKSGFTSPCGVCRQTLQEFCQQDFTIVLSDGYQFKEYILEELLPYSFSVEDLAND